MYVGAEVIITGIEKTTGMPVSIRGTITKLHNQVVWIKVAEEMRYFLRSDLKRAVIVYEKELTPHG